MKAWDIIAYSYKADIFCPECTLNTVSEDFGVGGKYGSYGAIEAELDELAEIANIDRYNEYSFDSDNFPKIIFADSIEEDEFCSNCHNLL